MKRKIVTIEELCKRLHITDRCIQNYMYLGRCKNTNGDIVYLKPDGYGFSNTSGRKIMAFSYDALIKGLGYKQLQRYKSIIDEIFNEEIEEPKEEIIEEAKDKEVLSTKTEINEKGEIIVTIVIKIK